MTAASRSRRRPASHQEAGGGAAALSAEEWQRRASEHLLSRGVGEVKANVEFIMAAVLKIGRGELPLHLNRALSARQARHFWNLVEERGKRVPLAYVLGSQGFLGFDIQVGPGVLIPRPETEELVVETIKLLSARAAASGSEQSPATSGSALAPGAERLHLLEIGTGSGCIAVALSAAFPQATVYATELSLAAMGLALRNAEAHHRSRSIRFIQEDLFKPGERRGWADLLISNPPYVPTAEIDGLEEEVRREPRMALDGGPDGLVAIRAIIAGARGTLRPDGLLVLEIGAGQAPAVRALLESAGFKASFRRDFQNHERIAIGAL